MWAEDVEERRPAVVRHVEDHPSHAQPASKGQAVHTIRQFVG
jgi:hypothetical protein